MPRREIGQLVLRARAHDKRQIRIGWSKEQRPKQVWANEILVDLIPDGRFHLYKINGQTAFRRGLEAGDHLRRLFLQPIGGDIELDYLRLTSRLAVYSEAPIGFSAETINSEMRPVLYVVAGRSLMFDIQVPAKAALLELGLAALVFDGKVEFEVGLTGANLPTDWRERQSAHSQHGWTNKSRYASGQANM